MIEPVCGRGAHFKLLTFSYAEALIYPQITIPVIGVSHVGKGIRALLAIGRSGEAVWVKPLTSEMQPLERIASEGRNQHVVGVRAKPGRRVDRHCMQPVRERIAVIRQ